MMAFATGIGSSASTRHGDATTHRSLAFGLVWQSDIALPLFRRGPTLDGTPDIIVTRTDQIADRPVLAKVNQGMVHADGIRLIWEDQAVFDMTDGIRIDYCPRPDWTGSMPNSFYSTVTALLLAWRGAVPFHASAVEIDGRAVLIAGPGGAGKSTLTAGLIRQGARLIGDDLSVVTVEPGPEGVDRVMVQPGRAAIRLHPQNLPLVDTLRTDPVPEDGRGKWLAWPAALSTAAPLPLAGMVLLGAEPGPQGAAQRFPKLRQQLFRPAWLGRLPQPATLMAALFKTAQQSPVIGFPAFAAGDESAFDDRGRAAASLIRSTLLG